MTITLEMMEKAKNAASVEELIALTEADGEKLSQEVAEKYFEKICQAQGENGSLADEELNNVSGGGFFCDVDPDDVRSTLLKCTNPQCEASFYGECWIGYFPPHYTVGHGCRIGQGKLYVNGYILNDGDYEYL